MRTFDMKAADASGMGLIPSAVAVSSPADSTPILASSRFYCLSRTSMRLNMSDCGFPTTPSSLILDHHVASRCKHNSVCTEGETTVILEDFAVDASCVVLDNCFQDFMRRYRYQFLSTLQQNMQRSGTYPIDSCDLVKLTCQLFEACRNACDKPCPTTS